MRRLALPFALVWLASAPALAQEAKAPAAPAAPPAPAAPLPDWLKPPMAQDSYLLGLQAGGQLRSEGITVDNDALNKGIADGLSGAPPKLSEGQLRDATERLQAEVMLQRAATQQRAAQANKTAGEAFLKTNGAKPGVTTLPSGLQYEVLTAGKGAKPKATDTVVCNYRGTLLDGTEFDSSDKHGGPATMPIEGLIKGWVEALQLMPAGSKWRLYVPPELAYGDQGAGGAIGPNSTLIFEIELVSVKKAA